MKKLPTLKNQLKDGIKLLDDTGKGIKNKESINTYRIKGDMKNVSSKNKK